jgi:hypothetical protein
MRKQRLTQGSRGLRNVWALVGLLHCTVKMDDDDAEDAVALGAAVAQAPVSEADAKIQAVCDNVLGEVAVQEAAK